MNETLIAISTTGFVVSCVGYAKAHIEHRNFIRNSSSVYNRKEVEVEAPQVNLSDREVATCKAK